MAQETQSTKKKNSAKRPPLLAFFTRKSVLIPLMLIVVLIVGSLIYYKPMRIWYREARRERVLREQLVAIREYNDELRQEIKSLDTTEGIEDYATSQLNLVHEGDNVVIVMQDGKPLTPQSDSRAQRIESLGVTGRPFGAWTGFFDSLFKIR